VAQVAARLSIARGEGVALEPRGTGGTGWKAGCLGCEAGWLLDCFTGEARRFGGWQ